MNQADYEKRNLQGFEGDRYMKAKFSEIINRRKIELVIETGTYLGGTTNQLRQMVKQVVTIEVNPDYHNRAKENIKDHGNVQMFLGDSAQILHDVLADTKIAKQSMLILLDAHWGDVCPLKDELKAIADAGIKPVIVIHDWLVPGTDFGYDSYKGQPFTWEWIEKDIFNIYGDQFTKYYNTMAEGARRGVLYIEPK